MAQVGVTCGEIVLIVQIFDFSMIENTEISEDVTSRTFRRFMVAEISTCFTLKPTFSRRSWDVARRGPMTPMLEEGVSHHFQGISGC